MANFTAIAIGAAANAATFNDPLTELDEAIGLLSDLATTAQSSVVAAINEVHDDVGTLSGLLTTDKDSLVDAVNEVYNTFASGGSIGGDVDVNGDVTADAFIGDGSGLTGIASGTGGVTNTGSTTIGADTDANGVGIIALQTRGSTKLDIENLGDVNIYYDLDIGSTAGADSNNLNVTGRVIVAGNISPASGAEAVLNVDASAYSDAGGSQWAAQFNRVYTVAGQTTVDELDGLLTALYHDEGFTLPHWKGVETGGGFIDGVGSVVTMFSGLEANIPTVSGGGSVVTAAALHIPSKATTGITNVYAILQEIVAVPSLFKGPIYVQDQALGLESYRDAGATRIQATTHQASATGGARLRVAFSRGTRASPGAVSAGDLIGQLEGYAYIDGDYRNTGALSFYASGTPGSGSYPSDMYFRLVSDSATNIATKAILSEAGDLTLGATKITGAVGGLYSGLVGLKDGVAAPSTVTGVALIYVDTSDGDLKVKFGDGTVKTIVTDT